MMIEESQIKELINRVYGDRIDKLVEEKFKVRIKDEIKNEVKVQIKELLREMGSLA